MRLYRVTARSDLVAHVYARSWEDAHERAYDLTERDWRVESLDVIDAETVDNDDPQEGLYEHLG